ncbi:MAG: carbohydrate kinase family protein [Verrucomicrobiae bacterium]|nr:carbohydrate kinase family protein [Verrucomicrobiae bacterium]
MKRKGIAIGGNWIIDYVKLIDVYPGQDTLANIQGQSQGNGGCAYTTLKDLARLRAPFPLQGVGLVGQDAAGKHILADCKRLKINTSQLKPTPAAPTSYTDVMTVVSSGRRTFFHNRGANALFSPRHVDLKKIPARIFHLGYLLLLDEFDKPDAKYGTVAARFLAQAQKLGFKTSVDCVSEDSNRFSTLVKPALRHVDYCIMNEIEAGRTTGHDIRRMGQIEPAALRDSARALLSCGVRDLVLIHFPEGAYALAASGRELYQPSLKLPQNFIKGTVGAGDAFCAGALYGLHESQPLSEILLNGVCAAASSLASPTASDSVVPMKQALALASKFGFHENLMS